MIIDTTSNLNTIQKIRSNDLNANKNWYSLYSSCFVFFKQALTLNVSYYHIPALREISGVVSISNKLIKCTSISNTINVNYVYYNITLSIYGILLLFSFKVRKLENIKDSYSILRIICCQRLAIKSQIHTKIRFPPNISCHFVFWISESK